MLVVAHRNGPSTPCADGMLAALILMRWGPGTEVKFVDYRELELLEPQPGVVFADICPRGNASEWLKQDRVFVLDHHKTAENTVRQFPGLFSMEPGVSGATLACDWVDSMREEAPPWASDEERKLLLGRMVDWTMDGGARTAWRRLARRIGIYDTWQRDDLYFDEAAELNEALLFFPWLSWMGAGEQRDVSDMVRVGGMLRRQTLQRARLHVEEGHRVTLDGPPPAVALFVNTTNTNDVADLAEGVDVVVGYRIMRGFVRYSMRTRTGFDCERIAKLLGGGGHKSAAGASVPFDPLPGPAKRWIRVVEGL